MWLADGRERAEWGRAFSLAYYTVASSFSGRRLRPEQVIPGRYLPDDLRPDPEREASRERLENDLAWAALGAGLRAGVERG